MKPNRIVSLMLAAALSAALLAGCSRGRNAAAETQSTPLIAPTAPAVTAMPDQTAAPAQGGQSARDGVSAATPMDWLRHAGDVEDRIRMFSEIESASIVVDGSVALVGVTFDGAYQGQLTQRIRDMVAGEVQAADPGVQTVGVTNDAEDVAAEDEEQEIFFMQVTPLEGDEVEFNPVDDDLSQELFDAYTTADEDDDAPDEE